MVKILNFLCVFFVSLLTLLPSSLFADVTKTINKSDIYPYVKADRPFVSPLTGKPLSNEGWTLTNEFGHFCHTFSEDIKELGHTGEDWIKYEDNWRNISGDKPIYSINNGVVLWSGLHTAGNGHAILIKHESHEKNGFIIPSTNHADDNKDSTCDPKGDGSATYSYSSSERRSSEVYSFYLHLGESLVKAGDSVYAGQRIGDLYTTQERIDNGYAYVPHLHFELWSSLEETSDNDLTVSFIDSQGYDTLRQFRNRLVSRLTNPSSFILTNNILPLVTGIERTDDKKIVISGKGFGISPGKVKVESSMFKDTISHISWKDDQVVTSDLAPFL